MEKIRSIASIEGRQLLRTAYEYLRLKAGRNSLAVLWTTWKLATTEKEFVNHIPNAEFTIEQPLGILRGTGVWLQEIVNRYYYPQVNALVYFGAALLLVLIGLNRFVDLSKSFVIAGIILEASLLLLLFVVLLFTPVQIDQETAPSSRSSDSALQTETIQLLLKDLVNDIGDIAKDYLQATATLEKMTEALSEAVEHQREVLPQLQTIVHSIQQFFPPPPDLTAAIRQTAEALASLRQELVTLQESVAKLREENIREAVRKELEKIVSNRLH